MRLIGNSGPTGGFHLQQCEARVLRGKIQEFDPLALRERGSILWPRSWVYTVIFLLRSCGTRPQELTIHLL